MSRSVELRRARPLLGTIVEICVRGAEEARARRAVAQAFRAIARVQRLMSFHEPHSDVSRLNRAAERRAVRVHPWTFAVLQRAQEFARASEGAFDITIAPTLCAWGYLPPNEYKERGGTFRDLLLLENHTVRFLRPLALDLGGIAKGFAVDRAVAALRAAGVAQGSVNAGGDLRVFGRQPEEGHPAAPAAPGGAAGLVRLQNRALASSGTYFSRQVHRGRRVSPLLDGRTRRPFTRTMSVAVSAPDCLTADALTKIVLALGPASVALLRAHHAEAVLLERDASPRLLSAHAT